MEHVMAKSNKFRTTGSSEYEKENQREKKPFNKKNLMHFMESDRWGQKPNHNLWYHNYNLLIFCWFNSTGEQANNDTYHVFPH